VDELGRWAYLAGAVPYVVLGTLHAFATPLTTTARRGLSPADPALAAAMKASRVLLTRRVDVWTGWVGFNLSHSLGAVGFGAFVVITGRTPEVFAMNASLAVPLALAVSLAYLVLGVRYFFRTPIVGICMASALFAAALVSGWMGR
jgi:hypothetical protein